MRTRTRRGEMKRELEERRGKHLQKMGEKYLSVEEREKREVGK